MMGDAQPICAPPPSRAPFAVNGPDWDIDASIPVGINARETCFWLTVYFRPTASGGAVNFEARQLFAGLAMRLFDPCRDAQ